MLCDLCQMDQTSSVLPGTLENLNVSFVVQLNEQLSDSQFKTIAAALTLVPKAAHEPKRAKEQVNTIHDGFESHLHPSCPW